MEALPDLNLDTIRDKYLRTPLHIACSRRDHLNAIRIANLLVKRGSDVLNQVGDIDGLLPMHMGKRKGIYIWK
jgi:ankyrin repeat protein